MSNPTKQELNRCLLTIYLAIAYSDGTLGADEGHTILKKANQLFSDPKTAQNEFNEISAKVMALSKTELWDYIADSIERFPEQSVLRKELEHNLSEIMEADGKVSESELSLYRKVFGLLMH